MLFSFNLFDCSRLDVVLRHLIHNFLFLRFCQLVACLLISSSEILGLPSRYLLSLLRSLRLQTMRADLEIMVLLEPVKERVRCWHLKGSIFRKVVGTSAQPIGSCYSARNRATSSNSLATTDVRISRVFQEYLWGIQVTEFRQVKLTSEVHICLGLQLLSQLSLLSLLPHKPSLCRIQPLLGYIKRLLG